MYISYFMIKSYFRLRELPWILILLEHRLKKYIFLEKLTLILILTNVYTYYEQIYYRFL